MASPATKRIQAERERVKAHLRGQFIWFSAHLEQFEDLEGRIQTRKVMDSGTYVRIGRDRR